MDFGKIIGSVAGGLLGGIGSKKSSGGTEQVKKEPWEAAQPWLKNLLAEGQNLQSYYQANPFNQQQQQAYNNIFSDANMFRSQIAPGLFGKANEMMGSNYQRRSFDRPGLVGYSPQAQQQFTPANVFGTPQMNPIGLLDFNPKQVVPEPVAAAPVANPNAELDKLVMEKLREQYIANIAGNFSGGG